MGSMSDYDGVTVQPCPDCGSRIEWVGQGLGYVCGRCEAPVIAPGLGDDQEDE